MVRGSRSPVIVLLPALSLLIVSCGSAGGRSTEVGSDVLADHVLHLQPWQERGDPPVFKAGLGSGVKIADDLLLTAAHVVQDIDSLVVNGIPVEYELIATGDVRSLEDDWSLLQLRTQIPAPSLKIYAGPAPEEDTTIYICALTEQDGKVVRLFGHCYVVHTPRGMNDASRLLFYRGPSGGGGFPGMSGGAACVWNAEQSEFELIGIHVGSLQVRVLGIRAPALDIGVIRVISPDEIDHAIGRPQSLRRTWSPYDRLTGFHLDEVVAATCNVSTGHRCKTTYSDQNCASGAHHCATQQ